MIPTIAISAFGILLAILVLATKRTRFWFNALVALASFMALFGTLTSWNVAFNPTGPYKAFVAFQGWIVLSVILTLITFVTYILVIRGTLKRHTRTWKVAFWTSLIAVVSGIIPASLSLVVFSDVSSSWTRVILGLAVLLLLFNGKVQEITGRSGGTVVSKAVPNDQ